MLTALFVSYSPLLGGGERILVELASRLPDCEPQVACPEGALARATRERGVSVLPLHRRRLELRGSTRDLVGAPLRLGAHAVEVRRLVEERRPDVLIAWGTRSAMACAAAIRTLSWRPPFIQQGNDLLTGPLIARAARETARRADLVVSLSATIARDLDPEGSLGERSAVAWPGVDIEAYAEIGPPPGAPHAVVLGAMVEWKRPMLALEAAAIAVRSLPDLTLTVAGPALNEAGEALAAFLRRRAEAPDLAGRVRLPGAVEDAREALAQATCLLHCADCEPFGMVLVEALAAGRAVVAPASCGPAEIVTPECGRLFVPGDARSAAEALVAVHSDPALPAELGAAGRVRAEESFRLEDSVVHYRELLDRVARPAAGKPAPRAARPRVRGEGATVAINARAAARREIGGVERVAREMAAHLPAVAPGRYRVVRPPPALAHRAGHLWEQAALPLWTRNAALIYSPAHLAPLASDRNVVVISDAAALRHPDWYTGTYAEYQRRVLPAIAQRARLVIAPSEFSRGEITDLMGVAPDRVAVVPHGVSTRFSSSVDPKPARTAHSIRGDYALVVGTRIARKNVTALQEAQRALAAEGVELLSAGSGRAYMRAGKRPPARVLGYVDDEILPGLYSGALALLMPSLYEGFGLPCLEAMASGVPVVAANRSALPETCGDAALLVDPDDPAAFADAAVSAATDDAVRTPLAAAGLVRAAEFTWERTAVRTDALIEELLSGRR